MKVQEVFEGLKMFPILKVIKVYDQGGAAKNSCTSLIRKEKKKQT